jgi:hypothetical protein
MLIDRKMSLHVGVYEAVSLYFICPMGREMKTNVHLPHRTGFSFRKPYSRSPPDSDAGLLISTSFNVGKNNTIKCLNTVTQRGVVKFQLNCLFIRIDIVINSADFLSYELLREAYWRVRILRNVTDVLVSHNFLLNRG